MRDDEGLNGVYIIRRGNANNPSGDQIGLETTFSPLSYRKRTKGRRGVGFGVSRKPERSDRLVSLVLKKNREIRDGSLTTLILQNTPNNYLYNAILEVKVF
jgi:hypothetical protein